MSEQESRLEEFGSAGDKEGGQERGKKWVRLPISEISEWTNAGGTPRTSNEDYWGDEIPWVQTGELTKRHIYSTEKRITEQGLEESSAQLFPPGTLLIGMYGEPTVGESALLEIEATTNQACCGIFPDTDIVNAEFLHQAMQYEKPRLYSLRAGSGQQNIRQGIIQKFELDIPPLGEQRKIASVLYTVDQAIEIANEISEQVRRVERGLQQTLFSGEHLDCERKEAPTLGKIPAHWETKTMGEVCDITMGSSPKSELYNESGDGLPFFQANNEFGLRNPEHDRWCSDPVKTADKGDSLMTLRGTYVGQMNVADRKCCIGRGLAGISAGESLLEEYLYQHLRRRERYVKSIAIGSTFDSVSSGDLENLPVAIPPKEEQEDIASTLKSVQKRLGFTETYINQLKRLKQGLMQDLLSGEVRTHDTDIEIVDEVLQHG